MACLIGAIGAVIGPPRLLAQSGDGPPPYPMLIPAGAELPYQPDEPWQPAPVEGGAPVAGGDLPCANWENGALQLLHYRFQRWVFFQPQDGQYQFCGIPLPYPPPPASYFKFAVRPLAEMSEAALGEARAEGVIPHERLADGGFALGFPSAPITVVLFEDYACPYCQVYEEEVIAPLIEYFVATGRARFEYRFYPTVDYRNDGYHSKLAACVGELADERFWLGHSFLYERAADNRLFERQTADLLAAATGLDGEELRQCARTVRQVDVDVALARQAGVRGTPMLAFRYLAEGQALSPARPALSFADLSALIKEAAKRQ